MTNLSAFGSRGRWSLAAGFLTAIVVALAGCRKQTAPPDGRALASVACATCHTLPSPGQMAPEEWPYLLAWMGNYLGYPADIKIDARIVATNFVPPKPVVTRQQFDAIRNYYLDQSVVDYKPPSRQPKPPVSTLFEPVPLPITNRVISMTAIDPLDHALIVGTSVPAGLLIVEHGATALVDVPSEPATFERIGDRRRIALMGHIGRDARKGSIVDLGVTNQTRRIVIQNHHRISAHCTADLDGDGKDDLVVCGFGDYPTGRVGVLWGGDEAAGEDVLLDEPGATWCAAADLDGDGKKDILVAIGSNRPRLVAFVNQGNRRFEERTIVTRPVGWGYNRCLLVDWDGDGKTDIVETCGNNIELRGRPLKSWHGVRVLHNDGNWKFHEVLFEPIPGAMDVAAGDFDHDGRVDLAVTAFCPDWRDAYPTTFLLLMHKADGTVERFGLDDRYWNRWLRVASGDAEGDGTADLILGAAETPTAIPLEHMADYRTLLQNKAAVLLLRNRKAQAGRK